MVDSIAAIGLAAACCTTLSFIPQVVHIVKSGNVEGISVGMYSLFTLGVLLWVIYGFAQNDLPVFLANFLTLILTLCVLGLTLQRRLSKQRRSVDQKE